jgi:hypothetical protein
MSAVSRPLRRLSVALGLTKAYFPEDCPPNDLRTHSAITAGLSDFLVASKASYLKDPSAGDWTVVMGNEAGGTSFPSSFYLLDEKLTGSCRSRLNSQRNRLCVDPIRSPQCTHHPPRPNHARRLRPPRREPLRAQPSRHLRSPFATSLPIRHRLFPHPIPL